MATMDIVKQVTEAKVRPAQVAKRLRRMTPLERTRILPGAPSAPADGASYVLVGSSDAEYGTAVAFADLPDDLRARRRRCCVLAGVYAMERDLDGAGLPADLFDLLPTLAEVLAEAAGRDWRGYDDLLDRFWTGELSYLHELESDAHPFRAAMEAMEARGIGRPADDLPAEGEIDVELELYRLTGAWGLDLTDEQAVDALNAVENAPASVSPVDALALFLRSLGKTVTYLTNS